MPEARLWLRVVEAAGTQDAAVPQLWVGAVLDQAKEEKGQGDVTEDQPTNGNGSMSVTEVTGLVQLFNNQLLATEGRLFAKMDDNSRREAERWVKHDQELSDNRVSIVIRFEKMEKSILLVEESLQRHLDREREEQIVVNARVQPVKNVFMWMVVNWKNVAILLIGLLGFAAVAADIIARYLGGS